MKRRLYIERQWSIFLVNLLFLSMYQKYQWSNVALKTYGDNSSRAYDYDYICILYLSVVYDDCIDLNLCNSLMQSPLFWTLNKLKIGIILVR